jgi:proteic killer suppression protein
LAKYGLPDRPFLLYFGRNHPAKGLPDLMEAMPDIAAAFPDFPLVAAGFKPEGFRPLLDPLVADGRLDESQVITPGWLDHDDLPYIIASATVCVFPSTWEGDPMVVIETAGAGTPLIATFVAPFVEHGRTGLVVPSRDPEALGRAVRRVLRYPERAAGMAAEALAKAQSDTYDWDTIVPRQAEVCRTQLRGGGNHVDIDPPAPAAIARNGNAFNIQRIYLDVPDGADWTVAEGTGAFEPIGQRPHDGRDSQGFYWDVPLVEGVTELHYQIGYRGQALSVHDATDLSVSVKTGNRVFEGGRFSNIIRYSPNEQGTALVVQPAAHETQAAAPDQTRQITEQARIDANAAEELRKVTPRDLPADANCVDAVEAAVEAAARGEADPTRAHEAAAQAARDGHVRERFPVGGQRFVSRYGGTFYSTSADELNLRDGIAGTGMDMDDLKVAGERAVDSGQEAIRAFFADPANHDASMVIHTTMYDPTNDTFDSHVWLARRGQSGDIYYIDPHPSTQAASRDWLYLPGWGPGHDGVVAVDLYGIRPDSDGALHGVEVPGLRIVNIAAERPDAEGIPGRGSDRAAENADETFIQQVADITGDTIESTRALLAKTRDAMQQRGHTDPIQIRLGVLDHLYAANEQAQQPLQEQLEHLGGLAWDEDQRHKTAARELAQQQQPLQAALAPLTDQQNHIGELAITVNEGAEPPAAREASRGADRPDAEGTPGLTPDEATRAPYTRIQRLHMDMAALRDGIRDGSELSEIDNSARALHLSQLDYLLGQCDTAARSAKVVLDQRGSTEAAARSAFVTVLAHNQDSANNQAALITALSRFEQRLREYKAMVQRAIEQGALPVGLAERVATWDLFWHSDTHNTAAELAANHILEDEQIGAPGHRGRIAPADAGTVTEAPVDPAHAPWTAAQTLSDLGALNAQWLEGTLATNPQYPRIEAETNDLTAVLAATNRAGFVTTVSQQGAARGSEIAQHWGNTEQRAAVAGFASNAVRDRLVAAATAAGLRVVSWRNSEGPIAQDAVRVSEPDSRQHATRFGHFFGSKGELWPEYAGAPAIDEIWGGWQVVIVDPEWGRNDRLWPMLERFAAAQTGDTGHYERTVGNGGGRFQSLIEPGQVATAEQIAAARATIGAHLSDGATVVLATRTTNGDVRTTVSDTIPELDPTGITALETFIVDRNGAAVPIPNAERGTFSREPMTPAYFRALPGRARVEPGGRIPVLIDTWEYPPAGIAEGGLGTVMEMLIRQLVEAGCDVTVLTRQKLAEDGETPLPTVELDIEGVHVIAAGLSEGYQYRSEYQRDDVAWCEQAGNAKTNALYDHMQRTGKRFALVEGHDWVTTEPAQVLKQGQDIPFVLHIHDVVVGRWLGAVRNPLIAAKHGKEWTRAQYADRVIVNSEHNKAMAHWVDHIPAEKITVIPNGADVSAGRIDRSSIDRAQILQELGYSPDSTLIFAWGRLMGIEPPLSERGPVYDPKGVTYLIDAVSAIKEAIPNAKLMIAGADFGGAAALQAQIDRLVAEGRLEPGDVWLAGRISDEMLDKAKAAANLVVAASPYEGFGLTVLEAAVAGAAVVATPPFASLKDKVTGLITPAMDPDALAINVIAALLNPELAAQWAANGRERAESDDYNWPQIAVRTVEEVFRPALEAGTSPVEVGDPPAIPDNGNVFDVRTIYVKSADGDYTDWKLATGAGAHQVRDAVPPNGIDAEKGAYWQIPLADGATELHHRIQRDVETLSVNGRTDLILPVQTGKGIPGGTVEYNLARADTALSTAVPQALPVEAGTAAAQATRSAAEVAARGRAKAELLRVSPLPLPANATAIDAVDFAITTTAHGAPHKSRIEAIEERQATQAAVPFPVGGESLVAKYGGTFYAMGRDPMELRGGTLGTFAGEGVRAIAAAQEQIRQFFADPANHNATMVIETISYNPATDSFDAHPWLARRGADGEIYYLDPHPSINAASPDWLYTAGFGATDDHVVGVHLYPLAADTDGTIVPVPLAGRPASDEERIAYTTTVLTRRHEALAGEPVDAQTAAELRENAARTVAAAGSRTATHRTLTGRLRRQRRNLAQVAADIAAGDALSAADRHARDRQHADEDLQIARQALATAEHRLDELADSPDDIAVLNADLAMQMAVQDLADCEAAVDVLAADRQPTPEELLVELVQAEAAERARVAHIQRDLAAFDPNLWSLFNLGQPVTTYDAAGDVVRGTPDWQRRLVERLASRIADSGMAYPLASALAVVVVNQMLADLEPGREDNCVAVVDAALLGWFGTLDAAVARTHDGYADGKPNESLVLGQKYGARYLERMYGGRFQEIAPNDWAAVRQQLQDARRGSAAVVSLQWDDGTTHITLVLHDSDGQFHYVDSGYAQASETPFFGAEQITAMGAFVLNADRDPVPFPNRPRGLGNAEPPTEEYEAAITPGQRERWPVELASATPIRPAGRVGHHAGWSEDEREIFEELEELEEGTPDHQELRSFLIEYYTDLVTAMAQGFRFAPDAPPFETLLEIGKNELGKAVDSFDPDLGSDFPTFAMTHVSARFKRGVQANKAKMRDARDSAGEDEPPAEQAPGIQSFANRETLRFWQRENTNFPPDIRERGLRKLEMLNQAVTLNDMADVPGNNFEKLKGDRDGQYSIRINQQWRIVFDWTDDGPENVEVVDYHRG